MLTKKGKYGLKAMVHLAQFSPGRPVPVLEIASTQQIPKKFLDAILSELRNAGFVNSKMGKGGGYMLARTASQISVGEIIRVIDGPLAPLPCASKTVISAATIVWTRRNAPSDWSCWTRNARFRKCSTVARWRKCA